MIVGAWQGGIDQMLTDESYWKVSKWETPATLYPRRKLGTAQISDMRYKKGIYEMYGVPAPDNIRYKYYRIMKPITITALEIENKTVMVDDVPHYYGMVNHAKYYSGTVLVAGLGLGLIVHTLAQNPDVSRIVVVERSQDVINLVGPLVPSKNLEIVHADWYQYNPDFQPDGVFYDLFVGDGHSLIGAFVREMITMKERFPSASVFRVHGFNIQIPE